MWRNGCLLVGNYYHILYQHFGIVDVHPTDYNHLLRNFDHPDAHYNHLVDSMLEVQQELPVQRVGGVEAHCADSIPEEVLTYDFFDFDNWAFHTVGGKQVRCMADSDGFVPQLEDADIHQPDRTP